MRGLYLLYSLPYSPSQTNWLFSCRWYPALHSQWKLPGELTHRPFALSQPPLLRLHSFRSVLEKRKSALFSRGINVLQNNIFMHVISLECFFIWRSQKIFLGRFSVVIYSQFSGRRRFCGKPDIVVTESFSSCTTCVRMPCYKRMGSFFSCACIELWMYLGGLESTQEARIALMLLLCSPSFPRASIIRYTHAKHKPTFSIGHRSAWAFPRGSL